MASGSTFIEKTKNFFVKIYQELKFRFESSRQNLKPNSPSIFREGRDHIRLVLQFSSILIKADGVVKKEELDFVKRKIANDFSQKIAESWIIKILNYSEYDLIIEDLAKKTNRSFNVNGKVQLLHFLAGIATKDTMLTENEFYVLKQIGMRIRIPFKTLESILALYDFITEEQANENRKQKGKPEKATDRHLKRAYIILELSASASDREVKKNYRKLVKRHHPDKVIHMGHQFKKQAEEKFKKIAEAYHTIKTERGMT